MSEELNIGALRSENAALHRSNSELRTACSTANERRHALQVDRDVLNGQLAQCQAERDRNKTDADAAFALASPLPPAFASVSP